MHAPSEIGMYRGDDNIERVAVIGAGVIGAGWAAAYLARGFEVVVFDRAPAVETRVRQHVAAAWPDMLALGRCARPHDVHRLRFAQTLEACVASADLVHESATEDPAAKGALIRAIDALAAPDVLIASSTSSLPVTLLQQHCRHPDRCVLGHPFNPVHVLPLVEIGGGEHTDPAAVDAIEKLFLAMGKQPIRVRREIFGHIANRLTSAMFREAVWLVGEGYATVADVDDALRYGPALKWAIQGQFTTFHTTGGQGGFESFLGQFAKGMVERWKTMQTPDLLDPDLQRRLVEQLGQAHAGRDVADIAERQDALLTQLVQLVSTDPR